MGNTMQVSAQFLRFSSPTGLRAGEARVLRVTGLSEGDTLVFLDAKDNVSRVQQGASETTVVPWAVEQVLHDVLDPHAVAVE